MNKQQLANKIWASANKMRSKIEANEYKDYILGLIFYKFLSDNEVNYLKKNGFTDEDLKNLVEDYENEDAKLLIDYLRNNIGYFIEYKNLFSTWLQQDFDFTVANLSVALNSFDRLVSINHKRVYDGIFKTLQAGLSKLGENPSSQTKALNGLIKLIKDIPTDSSQDYDVLGYIYEYLIGNFAANAGKKAGEFYTPHEVAILMSEIVAEHHKDKDKIEIYDPTSGSGSLLITIGKSVGRHIADKDRVKYYAQELKENTYNLTRMNLVMRGIQPSNIETRCADSLDEDWPIYTSGSDIGKPLYVDAVVSNPPYSQPWDSKDKEYDSRFKDYGIAPKSKADYAFLLHELHHIKPDGILTIVLPHGVLFRGGEEEQIRMNLIEKNNIDAIIGLPANIFFGTGIPTLIMILKQHRDIDDVLIIDASKGFVKDGKQNKLRACDIKHIADVYKERREETRFSKRVSRDKIRDNKYNLNIPRYVDSSEPAVKYDIYSTVFGGIPNSEIDELKEYWDAFPILRNDIFKEEEDKPYSTITVNNINEAIDKNKEVKLFKESYNLAFNDFTEELHRRLITNVSTFKELNEQDEISADIFTRLQDIPLIDKYAAYQALADHWQTIVNDIEIIQSEGIKACNVVEINYKIVKKGDEDTEVPDGYKGRIIPFNDVQTTLLSEELNEIIKIKKAIEETQNDLQGILESLDTEEQELLLNDDNSDFDKNKVNEAWNEILDGISTPETEILDLYLTLSKKSEKISFIENYPIDSWDRMEKAKDGTYPKKTVNTEILNLKSTHEFEDNSIEAKIRDINIKMNHLSDFNKIVKISEFALEKHTIETIESLDIFQIESLLELKWIQPIVSAINQIPGAELQKLCDYISALRDKYAVTFRDIEQGIFESEQNLAELIGQLKGDEFAIRGLSNLIKK